MCTLQEWHARYLQQARWTASLRQYLYEKSNIARANSILEVGCGTGAVLAELTSLFPGRVFGLDIERSNLDRAAINVPDVFLVEADGNFIPFPSGSFDVIVCHFLLLWLENPLQALQEMKRVIHSGGEILLSAEPDYGGRIDYPPELIELGRLQAGALRSQGADPTIGRQIASLLINAGLQQVETGILGANWHAPRESVDWELEQEVLLEDLQGLLPDKELFRLIAIDQEAYSSGERILFVPTFFGYGRKP
jgi:SAM-dependent methyltransferase